MQGQTILYYSAGMKQRNVTQWCIQTEGFHTAFKSTNISIFLSDFDEI